MISARRHMRANRNAVKNPQTAKHHHCQFFHTP
jgi:hypothetical protein